MPVEFALCRLDALPLRSARGLAAERLLAVRGDGALHLDLNRCRHTGGPLNWVPDGLLDAAGAFLQCKGHDGLAFASTTATASSAPALGTPVVALHSARRATVDHAASGGALTCTAIWR